MNAIRLWGLGTLATVAWSLSGAQAQSVSVDIKPQQARAALRQFGEQTGLQVSFRADEVAQDVEVSGVRGQLPAGEALERLLENTGLTYEFVNERTVKVRRARSTAVPAELSESPIRISQAERIPVGAAEPFDESGASQPADSSREELEEIIVTGTHISGVSPTSLVLSYAREDIEKQGFSSIRDFVQSIPQNFNGGASENTVFSFAGGAGNSVNSVNATGINLRGLGNDSTLVLLNGQRIAPGNTSGNFVDVSMIPLSAIERIEILPDSASAIYGSDAVGGVVNLILRRRAEGAETRLRYGSVTHGQRSEVQASQTLGHDWGSGSALATYEYSRETPLYSTDRDYAKDRVSEPFTLLPRQIRQGALLTGRQELASGWELFGTGTYSHRESGTKVTYLPFYSYGYRADIDAYSASVGARSSPANRIRMDVSAAYSSTNTESPTDNLLAGLPLGTNSAETSVGSLDAKVAGSAWDLRTGTVQFALGAQFRREKFEYSYSESATSAFDNLRKVSALFAEVHVPIVGPRPGSSASVVEFEAAGRIEHYNDFGTSKNPKLGILWRPLPQLTLHANWGTSFVAPLLNDLNPLPTQVVAVPSALFELFTGPGAPDALGVFGGNPDLKPQKSRAWTAGLDFATPDRRLTAYTNYYRIKYRDRITSAQALVPNLLATFGSEDILGPQIIQRNAPPGRVQELINDPTFQNFGVADPSAITVIIDDRTLNLASVQTSGIDFGVSYDIPVQRLNAQIGVDGTYILDFDNQFTSSAPVTSFLNRPYNPIDLRLRAWGSIGFGPYSAAAYVNYTDSYENDTVGPQLVSVSSWTTVDLTLGYESNDPAAVLNGVTALLGVRNVFNKEPPFVLNASGDADFGLNYDGANANVLGRFVYLQLSRRW